MTVGIVGVILNLALCFALKVVFGEVRAVRTAGLTLDGPVLALLNLTAALLSAAALVAVFRLHLGALTVLAAAAGAGVVLHLAGLS